MSKYLKGIFDAFFSQAIIKLKKAAGKEAVAISKGITKRL